jgi:hypothetical protein
MGYDIHITRRAFWIDEGNDITLDEFICYVRSDAEFKYPGLAGDDSANWRSPNSGYESWLCWSDGQIYTKNPEPEFIDKIVSVAKALLAKAQGDDGEVYLSATEIQKGEAEPSKPAPSPQPFIPPFFKWPLRKQLIAAFLIGCAALALRILIFGW